MSPNRPVLLATTLCAAILVPRTFAGPVSSRNADDTFEFEQVASEYLSLHGADAEDLGGSYRGFLRAHHATIPAGLFDLLVPVRCLAETGSVELVKEATESVLRTQDLWLQWCGVEGKRRKATHPDLETLLAWVRSWKKSSLAGAFRQATFDPEFLVMAGADAKVRSAASSLREFLMEGAGLGMEPDPSTPIPLVLCPDRQEFVGLACLVGSLSSRERSYLWTEDIVRWSVFRSDDWTVLALVHPLPTATPENYLTGMSMNERERTGLGQQLSHYAGTLLGRRLFGGAVDPLVAGGLASELVIELYGENNARAGGREDANETAARSKFVAGGNSSGGKFARVSAESQWRQDKGKDHFVGVLRDAQKKGLKEVDPAVRKAAPPFALFALESDDRARHHVVRGPFLGDSLAPELPALYVSDFLEFLRAYRCAFVYWLREHAVKGDGKEAFAQLLVRSAGLRHEGGDFTALVEEVYGQPLTATDLSVESLESRFLQWVARR